MTRARAAASHPSRAWCPSDPPGAPRRRARLRGGVAAAALVLPMALSLAVPASASPQPATKTGLAATGTTTTVHGFGYLPSATSLSASRLVADGSYGKGTLPASVDLTAHTVASGDQGAVNSCVSWALGYAIAGWYSRVQTHPGSPYAPMYLYSQVVQLDAKGRDVGSTLDANLSVIEKQGIAEKATYPQGDLNFTTGPTATERANASTHRLLSHTRLFEGFYQGAPAEIAVKRALAAGTPVLLALPVFTEFMQLNAGKSLMTTAMTGGDYLGMHAVAAFGYNANGVVIENSWGTTWGKAGFATLSWNFIDTYVLEADAISRFRPTVGPSFAVSAGSPVPASSGGRLTLHGKGFGTTKAAFVKARIGARVDGLTVPLTWVSNTTATVPVPPGLPGAHVAVGLTVAGATGASSTTAVYGANIATLPGTVDPTTGVITASVTGRGFTGSTAWIMTAPDGTTTLPLVPQASAAELAASDGGVLITSNSTAAIQLPADPGGPAGTWRLSFTPDRTTYPAETFVPSARAVWTYTVPALTSASVTDPSGSPTFLITINGTNLAAASVSDGSSTLKLVSVTAPQTTLNAQLTSVTSTQLGATVTVPTLGGVPVDDTYRIVLTTPLGTSTLTPTLTLP